MLAQTTTSLTIEPPKAADYDGWLMLWDANNQGLRNEEVTAETWRRLNDPDSPVCGLVARVNGHVAGLVHYILHPTTGHIAPVCYMQDVFVAPLFRRQGIARCMIEELAMTGRKKKWARLYWLAESSNEAAQQLYRDFGVKLNFSLHVMPL